MNGSRFAHWPISHGALSKHQSNLADPAAISVTGRQAPGPLCLFSIYFPGLYKPSYPRFKFQELTEFLPWAVASGDARSPPSDTDERPVRKQLKETSIDSSNMATSGDSSFAASAPEPGSGRKRSFEEARGDTDDALENGDGPRKRSRECTPEDAKKGSAAVPASDNVSDPNHPKDPVPATPKDLATDESSHGTSASSDVEVIAISDSEPEDFNAHPGIIEIIEISSDSESESEPEIAEVPDFIEVISISDSESESEEEARTPAPTHTQGGGFDSAELKSPEFSVSRESTLELEIPGAQIEQPARSPSEASSSGWSSGQETWCLVEMEDTPESEIPGAQTEHSARSPSEASSSGWSSSQETWCFIESDNTNTSSQDPKKLDNTDAMNDDDAKGPTKKRSLEQLQEEGAKEAEETENKRHRDNSQERETQTANVSSKRKLLIFYSLFPFPALVIPDQLLISFVLGFCPKCICKHGCLLAIRFTWWFDFNFNRRQARIDLGICLFGSQLICWFR